MKKLFSNKAFVRLFSGRLISNAGDSLYTIAVMWLVYEWTGSATFTGIAGFLLQLPRALQFLVGPLVDRWDLRKIFVRTQLIQCVLVLAIPVATLFDPEPVWLLLTLVPMLAFINQFLYPAQNAALPRILEDDLLVRANSMLSLSFQSANVVFNAASGIVISLIGAVSLFVINSGTFAIAAVLFMGVTVAASTGERNESADDESSSSDQETEQSGEPAAETEPTSLREELDQYLDELRAGIDYVHGSLVVLLILGAMVANVALGALFAVLPAFADLFGSAEAYGILMAAFAGGSLLGSLSATVVEDKPFGWVSIAGFCVSGLAILAAVVVPGFILTAAMIFIGLMPVGIFNVMFFSMLQSSVDENYLGRVSSVVSSVSAGMMPLGSLLGGIGADLIGVEVVFGGFAGMLILMGVYYALISEIRTLPSIVESDEEVIGISTEN